MPPLSFLTLLNLRHWHHLPKPWLHLLGVFLALQLLAAALTPNPLLSVPLALGRATLTIALIITGALLGSSALRPALVGYSAVAVTAFATTLLLNPSHPLATRLIHPYSTSVSLGLAGTTSLLLALTWKGGPVWWRVLGGTLSLGMFLWSGSRGPLIALTAGLLAALAVNLRGQWRSALIACAGAAILLFTLQSTQGSTIATRFLENTLNGRGTYWADALDTAQAHPWGGVGPYQLGPHLTTQYSEQSCQLWLPQNHYGLKACPPALNQIRGMWLIAHNTAFHLLAETGVIGTSGWLALMGALALAAWRSRDPLLNGITWATAAMGLVDNPTLLPNLGHAELYWIAGGVALALPTPDSRNLPLSPTTPLLTPIAPLLACAFLSYWSIPLLDGLRRPMQATPLPTLNVLAVPTIAKAREPLTLFLNAEPPPGKSYSLSILDCPEGSLPCRYISKTFLSGDHQNWYIIGVRIPTAGQHQLQFQLQDQATRLGIDRPLAELVRVIHAE